MKNTISYFWIIGFIIYGITFTACQDDSGEEAVNELTLKVYSPTVVMAGGEMIITGKCLEQVNSIIFPGNVQVTNFELVTSNQIRLFIPANIAAEGGFLHLISDHKTVESVVSMRLAHPVVRSLLPGDNVEVGQELTFKGLDLEYIQKVIFPAQEENETITIEAFDFIRKGSENLKVKVPEGVKNGENTITLVALDGSNLESNQINLIVPEEPGGVIILWEGEFVIGGWDATLDLGIEYFQDIQPGNIIRFYFNKNESEGWWQLKVCDNDWAGFPGLDATGLENYPDGYADLEITPEVYDRIMVSGLHVQGANFTLIKMELL